jgi:hypothetical protein
MEYLQMLVIAGGIILALLILGLLLNPLFGRLVSAGLVFCIAALGAMLMMGPSETVQWPAIGAGGIAALVWFYRKRGLVNTVKNILDLP